MKQEMQKSPLMIGFANGVFFAIVWGGLMWFTGWKDQDGMTPLNAIGASILAGALFGFGMTLMQKRRLKKEARRSENIDT